jgi:hypothetical protein
LGLALAALTTASLAGGVGLAVGSAGSTSGPGPIRVDRQVTHQEVHAPGAAAKSALAGFAPSGTAATPAQQATLRNALGADANADFGAIGNADFSLARGVPIRGSSQDAWLVPSGDEICIVLPDPLDGFGATCQTLSAIRDGKGVLIITPPAGSGDQTAVVAEIVPDGVDAPSLETPQGSKRLPLSGEVAASVASTSDKIATPRGTLSLAAR